MQLRYTKAALTALWIVTVILATLTSSLTSPSSGLFLAVLAAIIPPTVFWQLWNAPVPSMSESIRTALKD